MDDTLDPAIDRRPADTPADDTASAGALAARLERLPRTTRSHRGWMVLLGILFACDLADTNALSYAAPAIRAEWGLSVAQIGQLTSYSFIGMFVGAILGGRLSDRFGRKRTVVWATVFYALASLLSAIAPNLAVLGVLRVLTGLGIQAVTGVLIVYVAEMFPGASRGRCQALMLGIGLLGVPLIAGAARLIVPLGPDAWRWLFVVGAIGLVPAVVAQFLLPESVRWAAVNRRVAEARSTVEQLESQLPGPLPEIVEHPQVEAPHRPTDLFAAGIRKRTIVASLTMVFGILGFYGFNSWVPTLLVEKGYSTTEALSITTIFSVAPFIGALGGMALTDRFQRRTTSLVLTAVIAAAMLVFAFTGAYWLLVASGFLVTLLLQTNTAVVYAYLPEVFPTALRGLGAGFANGLGRLAGFGGAFLVAAIAGALGFGGVFTATAVFVLLGGLTVGLFGERTRGRRLEEIGGDRS
ncbi:MFS transporter [Pseudonocardia kujensis]|uniref:MFS transporter n=1 Tax=Pseudonocardia kujensis TaxID=1128675 RepID=UPI001E575F18|nr:MFS transporter [Pseudonocardia kujensis]MCE0763688.1 MFS transporter [Pseudonocardia kujensis]